MLIYLHGFNSSPASWKARQLAARLASLGLADRMLAPALPVDPHAAIAEASALIRRHPDCCLIGSSLGGFYATWLAEQFAVPAVLINPAVQAPTLLAAHVGPQQNLYTQATYDWTAAHVAALADFAVPVIRHPAHYLVLLGRADEVLDWQPAAQLFAAARCHIVDGADHGFSVFDDWVDAVLQFAGIDPAARL